MIFWEFIGNPSQNQMGFPDHRLGDTPLAGIYGIPTCRNILIITLHEEISPISGDSRPLLVWDEPLSRATSSALSEDRCTVTASAEAGTSWIRRRFYHHTVPGQPLVARRPAERPHRRVNALGYALGETVLAASLDGSCGGRCTVTASAEAITPWIRRQFYHRTVPGQHLDAQVQAYRPTRRVYIPGYAL